RHQLLHFFIRGRTDTWICCNKKYRCHAVKYCYCQHKHVSEKQFFVVMFKHNTPSRFFWICVRPSLYSIKKKKKNAYSASVSLFLVFVLLLSRFFNSSRSCSNSCFNSWFSCPISSINASRSAIRTALSAT